MKKSILKVLGTSFILGMFFSCASTKVAETTNTVSDDADKVVVVDWADRTLGEIASPAWLLATKRGNGDVFKKQWGIDQNRVIKIGYGYGQTEAAAQAISRAGFSFSQAAELSQKVIGRVGSGLNDQGQLEALYTAATEVKAEMTGLREEAGFWQKVKRTNSLTKEVTEGYQYYTIYSMDKDSWANICKKYLLDTMGGEGLTTETQKQIGALFTEMKEDADKKDEAKYKEEERLYKLQMERLETQKAQAEAEIKKADTKEAKTKSAVQTAIDLASFLL